MHTITSSRRAATPQDATAQDAKKRQNAIQCDVQPGPLHLSELARTVEELQHDLQRRVRREEGVGGFLAFLCMAAPGYLSFVPTLRAEHCRLLNALAAVRAKIARAGCERYVELLAETDAVVAAIAEHERLERDLLEDALERA